MNARTLGYRAVYDPDTGARSYVVDTGEAAEVKMVFGCIAQGLSTRVTAWAVGEMTERNWTNTMVDRVLHREYYWKGEHAFVDPQIAKRALKQLAKRRPTRKGVANV